MTIPTNLFSHRLWFHLVPDSNHRLVVTGYGTYSDSGDGSGNYHVAAAGTPDGRLAIAYLPAGHPVDLDMTRMAGRRVRAHWYDPTSGKYTMIQASAFARRGRRMLLAPGKNHDGDPDWVLVLTAT